MNYYHIIILYLAVINLLAFLLMGIDKNRAIQKRYRIPEKRLFLAAIIGGSAGATLGMHIFRHKTKHWYFRYGFPLILLIHLTLLGFILPGISQ